MKRYETTMTVKALNEIFYISRGNKKLKSGKKIKFLIWNLPAVITCPFAGICKGFCYAKKAEKYYPSVLPCRMRNLEFSMSEEFVPLMIEFIKIQLNRLKDGQQIWFRIHESGDFYSAEYLEKWVEICKFFALDKRIVFLAYTKSHKYFAELDNVSDEILLARYSVCDDTTEEDKALAEELGMPIYEVIPDDKTIEDYADFFLCLCEDCASCGACYNPNVRKIAVEKH